MPPVHVPVNLRLCYITDRLTLHPTPLLPFIERAIIAGVDLIQIREKDLGTRPLIDLVKPAVESARSTRTRILVNDRLDVALGAGAAGVHLGKRSLPPEVVRERVAARARAVRRRLSRPASRRCQTRCGDRRSRPHRDRTARGLRTERAWYL